MKIVVTGRQRVSIRNLKQMLSSHQVVVARE